MTDPGCSTAVPRRARLAAVAVAVSLGVVALTAMLATGSAAAPLMDGNLAEQNNTTTQVTATSSTGQPSTPTHANNTTTQMAATPSTASNTTTPNEELFTGESSTNETGGATTGVSVKAIEAQETSKSVLTIAGNGSYDFRVVANLTGAQTGPEDLISEHRARGKVNGSKRDIYVFDYGLMEFDSNGSVQVVLNGNPINPQVLNGHRLAVYKDPPETENGSTEYEISVTGSIAPSALGNRTQIVDKNTARGALDPYDGITAFYYTGEITQFDIVGNAQVTLDNDPVDPEDVPVVAPPSATTDSQPSVSDEDSASKSGQGETRASVGTEASTIGRTTTSSGSGPGFGLGAAAGALVLSLAAIAVRRRL